MKHCLFPHCHAYYQMCQHALGMAVDLERVIYEAELPLHDLHMHVPAVQRTEK